MKNTNRRVVLGTLALLTASLGLGAGPNLLTNHDFASGTTGWQRANSDVTLIHRTDVGSTLPGGSGAPCLEVRNVGSDYSFSGAVQALPVTPGHQYLVSASVLVPQADNPATEVGAVVSFWTSSAFISSVSLYASPTPYGAWQRFEGAVVAPAGATTVWVNLSVRNPKSTAPQPPSAALFDDAYLGEMATTGQEVHELYLPVASSKGGLGGTFWTTDVWLTNLATTSAAIRGTVLVPGQDNGAAVAGAAQLLTVSGAASTSWTDIVSRLGVSNITGAIYLRAETPATETARNLVTVSSRNSTRNPAGAGRYGQAVIGVRAGERAVATASGLVVSDAFHTNVGVLNTCSDAISVAVEVRNGSGWTLAATTWSLLPYEPRMVNATSLGITSLDGGTVIFSLASPTGSLRGFLSVVDNGTNDSIYIPAS